MSEIRRKLNICVRVSDLPAGFQERLEIVQRYYAAAGSHARLAHEVVVVSFGDTGPEPFTVDDAELHDAVREIYDEVQRPRGATGS